MWVRVNKPEGCSTARRLCLECLKPIHKLDSNYELKVCKECESSRRVPLRGESVEINSPQLASALSVQSPASPGTNTGTVTPNLREEKRAARECKQCHIPLNDLEKIVSGFCSFECENLKNKTRIANKHNKSIRGFFRKLSKGQRRELPKLTGFSTVKARK